eukprot:5648404-Amphidinium_carterae.1
MKEASFCFGNARMPSVRHFASFGKPKQARMPNKLPAVCMTFRANVQEHDSCNCFVSSRLRGWSI